MRLCSFASRLNSSIFCLRVDVLRSMLCLSRMIFNMQLSAVLASESSGLHGAVAYDPIGLTRSSIFIMMYNVASEICGLNLNLKFFGVLAIMRACVAAMVVSVRV